MFENPRRGRQARNVTTNAPKILDLKSPSEQIFSRKLPLGAPDACLLSKMCENKKPNIGVQWAAHFVMEWFNILDQEYQEQIIVWSV